MHHYSDRVLEDTPERVTKFLCALGAVPVIRSAMEFEGGMINEDIAEGRTLLNNVLAAPRPPEVQADTVEAEAKRRAIVELDAWDEDHFSIAKATLSRHFPDAGEYVFHDLKAARGSESVYSVATFLTRVKILEEGTDPNRAGTQQEDRHAVELLTQRRITPEIRRDLQAKVDLALSPAASLPVLDPLDDPEKRREALIALKLWFDEWSSIAHAVVKKRGHLIRLGLASRRMANKGTNIDEGSDADSDSESETNE